jgi:uncharacterized protein
MSFNKIRNTTDWKALFNEANIARPIYYTLSGSHLYGFNSPDSDIDIRGCHCEELSETIGLHTPKTERSMTKGDLDIVSFDLKKELGLMLSNNSNVMENILAEPIYKKPQYDYLRELAQKSISAIIAKPFWGMAEHNLHLYIRTFNPAYREKSVKKSLYVLRAYMAGIYVLERGRIESNLKKLNKMRRFRIPIVDELIEAKIKGTEHMTTSTHQLTDEVISRLQKDFKYAEANTVLPQRPDEKIYQEANKFLLDMRTSI